MDFELVAPSTKYKESYFEALHELETKDVPAWIYNDWTEEKVRTNFNAYVQNLLERETHPKAPLVADTIFWAVKGKDILGRISLRHELTPYLRNIGGHIGYIVRPSARKKGIASRMLAKVLALPKARSVGKILITCDETNLASIKIIEKAGGKLSGTYQDASKSVKTLQYWINL